MPQGQGQAQFGRDEEGLDKDDRGEEKADPKDEKDRPKPWPAFAVRVGEDESRSTGWQIRLHQALAGGR